MSGWSASFATRERVFGALVDDARRLCAAGDDAEAANAVSIAAEYAWRCPFGVVASPELEAILHELGPRLFGDDQANGAVPTAGVLHVATHALSVGGHTRILRQWVRGDSARTHDLALTAQQGRPVPSDIVRAIEATGGTVHDLSASPITERVRALRAIAATRRFCVVHQDPSDVVPSLALSAGPRTWSTILVDHADHVFWLGTKMADVVAHLRPAAIALAARHRGLPATAATMILLPFEPAAASPDREAARERLGIRPADVVVLSVASEYKFGDGTSAHFLDGLECVLSRHDQLQVLVVGPRPTGRWRAAAERFSGRVRAVGVQADIGRYLAAADIYVDSHPFPSFTSAMQAAQQGLPTLGRRATHPDVAYLQLDDEAGGAAITWAADDAALATIISHWVQDAQARRRAGHAAAEAVRCVSRDDEWRRSIERTYGRAAEICTGPAAQDVARRLPVRLAEAVADAHHWGRVDGAFVHAMARDWRGGSARAHATRCARTLWRMRADRRSQQALFGIWRDRAATRLGRR